MRRRPILLMVVFGVVLTAAGIAIGVSTPRFPAQGPSAARRIHTLYHVLIIATVPDFSQKLDAVPGITTTLRVTPDHTGSFPVECTELCGAGHGLMRAAVRVVTPQAFQTWLTAQRGNAAPPIGTPPSNATSAPLS